MPEPTDDVGFWEAVKDKSIDTLWPPDSEYVAWQLADEWASAAKLMESIATVLEDVVTRLPDAWWDTAGVQFRQALAMLPENYRNLALNMRLLADGVRAYGDQIREARISILWELAVNIGLFVALSWIPGGGFLAAGLARAVASRITATLTGMAGRIAAGFAKLSVEVGKEMADEAFNTAATQLTSMLTGTREEFDLAQLRDSTITGGVGGLLGEGLGKTVKTLGNATRRVVPSLPTAPAGGVARNLHAGLGSSLNNAVTSPSAGYIVEHYNDLGALTDLSGYGKAISDNGLAAGLSGAPRSMAIDAVQQRNPGHEAIANAAADRLLGNPPPPPPDGGVPDDGQLSGGPGTEPRADTAAGTEQDTRADADPGVRVDSRPEPGVEAGQDAGDARRDGPVEGSSTGRSHDVSVDRGVDVDAGRGSQHAPNAGTAADERNAEPTHRAAQQAPVQADAPPATAPGITDPGVAASPTTAPAPTAPAGPAPTSAAPTPTAPTPTAPAPTAPASAAPTPTAPASAAPTPTHSAPAHTASSQPAPTQSAPTQSAPTQAAPTNPAATQPTPDRATPTQAAPTTPARAEQTTTRPTPQTPTATATTTAAGAAMAAAAPVPPSTTPEQRATNPKPAPTHTRVASPPPATPPTNPPPSETPSDETPDIESDPLPPPQVAPHSLGAFKHDLRRHPVTGHLTHIGGVPVRVKLRELARTRTEAYESRRKVPDSEVHAKKIGGCVALVMDLTTGEVFESTNSHKSVVVLKKFRPQIRARIMAMFDSPGGFGGNAVDGRTTPKRRFKGFDSPFRHAEVRAADAALTKNPHAKLADLAADVTWVGAKGKPPLSEASFCPNCSEILHDVRSNVHKTVHDPVQGTTKGPTGWDEGDDSTGTDPDRSSTHPVPPLTTVDPPAPATPPHDPPADGTPDTGSDRQSSGPGSHNGVDPDRPSIDTAHARHGEATPAGVSHHGGNPDMGDLPHRVRPDPHHFTADVHITPDGRARIGDHTYSAEEYGDLLRRIGWDGRTPIRLIGCDAGSNDFARNLSRHTGAEVLAPTEPAWTDAKGRVYTSTAEIGPDGTRRPKIPPTGEWETHHSDGTRTRAGDDGYVPGTEDADKAGHTTSDGAHDRAGLDPADDSNDPAEATRQRAEKANSAVEAAYRAAASTRTDTGDVATGAVADLLNALPSLPDDSPDSIRALVATVFDGTVTLEPIGGRDGAARTTRPVYRVVVDGKPVGIVKVVPKAAEFARELSAADRLHRAELTAFDVPDVLAVASVPGPDGTLRGALFAALAPGQSIDVLLSRIPTAWDRDQAVDDLRQAVTGVAEGMAELHRDSDRQASPSYLTTHADAILGHLDELEASRATLDGLGIDLDQIRAAVEATITAAMADPGPAGLTHGDAHLGNFLWDAVAGTSLIDAPTLHQSMNATGDPIGTPARDVALFTQRIGHFGVEYGLTPAEIAELRRHFADAYTRNGGPTVPAPVRAMFEARAAAHRLARAVHRLENRPSPRGKPDVGAATAALQDALNLDNTRAAELADSFAGELPGTPAFRRAWIAIDNFRSYMLNTADPATRARFESEHGDRVRDLQSRQTQEFKALWDELFPHHKDEFTLSPEGGHRAEEVIRGLATIAENLLTELAEFARTTGDPALTEGNVASTVDRAGTAAWEASFREVQAKINDILANPDFNYRGRPIGYIGSMETGLRGPHKGKTRFDPNDFDVDLYAVVDRTTFDEIAAEFPDLVNNDGTRIMPDDGDPEDLVELSEQIGQVLKDAFPLARGIENSVIALRVDQPW